MGGQRKNNRGGLFDGPGPTPKPAKDKAPPAALHGLMAQYRDGYAQLVGEPPHVLARDWAILKRLVAEFGAEKVADRLKAFLAWDDPYVRSTGYALHVFDRQWNSLAASLLPGKPPARVPDAERTDAYRKGLR